MPAVLTYATTELLLPAPAAPDVRETLSHRLVRLAAVDAAHLARLRQVREVVDGFVLVHEQPQDAVPLSSRAIGSSTSETLALGLALVQALAALHSSGLAHGGVTPDVVLVGADGSVTLTAAGAAWEVLPARIADDVAALAQLLLDRLDPDSIGSPLALLLVRAVDAEPDLRPRLAELGEALERAARPDPVPRPLRGDAAANRLAVAFGGTTAPEAAPRTAAQGTSAPQQPHEDVAATPAAVATGRHARPGPDRVPRAGLRRIGLPRGQLAPARVPWRGILLLVVWCVGVALLVQGAVGLWRMRAVVTTASTPPTGSAAPLEWRALVTRLDSDRRAAIDSGSTATLAEVVDPDGPAYARDVATLQARADVGLTLVGGVVAVTDVTVVEEGPGRAVLEVTDTRGPWELRDAESEVVASGPARGAASWRVVLSRDGDRWRYDEVIAR